MPESTDHVSFALAVISFVSRRALGNVDIIDQASGDVIDKALGMKQARLGTLEGKYKTMGLELTVNVDGLKGISGLRSTLVSVRLLFRQERLPMLIMKRGHGHVSGRDPRSGQWAKSSLGHGRTKAKRKT